MQFAVTVRSACAVLVRARGLARSALVVAPYAQAAAPQAPADSARARARSHVADRSGGAHRAAAERPALFPAAEQPAGKARVDAAGRERRRRSRRKPDQRGLAHFLEHMAFNGTEHFKPGELVSFLESIGARFGPHVNASTSFDETIYMLDIPTDKPGYVEKGHAGAARFRRRHFAAARGSREGTRRRARRVARTPRRRLAPDRQAAAGHLPGLALCRAPADRLARDPEERAARAAAGVLREVVSPRQHGGGRGRRHAGRPRPRSWFAKHFGKIPAAKGAAASVDTQRAGAQGHADQHVDRSGSAGLVGVDRVQGQGRARPHGRRLSQDARRKPGVADAEPAACATSRAARTRRSSARRPAPATSAARSSCSRSKRWCPKARSPKASARSCRKPSACSSTASATTS